MQKIRPLHFLLGIFALLLALLVLVLFMVWPGMNNFLQHSGTLFEWQHLPTKLNRINIFDLLINQVIALFAILLFGVTCISFGLFVLKLIRVTNEAQETSLASQLSILSSAYLLGQGTLSLIFILLGGYALLQPVYVILLLIVCFLVGGRELYAFRKSFSLQQIKVLIRDYTLTERLLIGISIGGVLILMFLSSSRLSYDSVAVYFSDAKLTALLNMIEFFQFRKYLVSNFQTGAIFSVLIQLFGDQAARMLSWISLLVIFIFSLSVAHKAGLSKRAKLIFLIMLLTTTALTDLAGDGKVELNGTVFVMAVVYWAAVSISSPLSTPVYFLVGIFTGFAMIARPYNIPLLAAFMGLFYLWQLIASRKEKGILAPKTYLPFVWIAFGIMPLLGFYLFANWLLTGSAFTPIQATQEISQETWQWAISEKYLWLLKSFYPLVVTYINTAQSLGNISPLVLAALPMLLIKQVWQQFPRSKILMRMFLAALLVLIFWLLTTYVTLEIRYIFFLWIILYMPAATILSRVTSIKYLPLPKIVDVFLIIILIFSAFRSLHTIVDSYSPIDSSGEPQCYDMPFCELVNPVNANAAPGDRVLTLNAYRYYLHSYLFTCSTRAEEYKTLVDFSHQNIDAFWAEVHRQGYKYIVYEPNYSVRHLRLGLELDTAELPDWLVLETIYTSPENEGYVYKIHIEQPPGKIEKTCFLNERGIWQVYTIDK